jgi:UDP-3-O-[3-hydroxymyristoyl] glucosamine N-acyltransferase
MTRTAGELADYLGASLTGDRGANISGVASPEEASAEDLVYIDSPRHTDRAAKSRAACILAKPGTGIAGKALLAVSDPKLAFAKAAAWLLPASKPSAGIHPTAVVAASATIAKTATIGPYVVIEEGAQVGSGSWIEAFCFVGAGGRVGEGCRLHPRVTLYADAQLRDRVEVHSGVVIGGDGFGYVFGEGRHWKFPQVGGVEISDDVEIGVNTAVDRGSLGNTRIGAGTKIDNLVQVAHNVEVGEHTILVSQVGISGSSRIGDYVVVAGQAGFGDHAIVEDKAIIGGQAGILPGKTIRAGEIVWGTPARPFKKFKEQFAHLSQLPELARRVRALEQKTGEKSGEKADKKAV